MPRNQTKASAQMMDLAAGKAARFLQTTSVAPLATDGLASRYTCVADDATAAAKKREASMLFSVAEGQLADNGDVEEAIRGAKEALANFQAANDSTGIADSTRLLVNAYRRKADLANWEPEGESKAAEALKLGEDTAREQLTKFSDAGDKRGQGAMSLSVAEVTYVSSPFDPLSGDYQKRADAMELATTARELFAEAGDEKMEALACRCLFRLAVDKLEAEKALELANDALKLFKKIEDQKGEAGAHADLAQARYMCAMIPEAIKSLKTAVKIFRETGPKTQVGLCLLMQGQLCLITDRAKEALPLAKEALEIFQGHAGARGYLPAALAMVVRAYALNGEVPKALAVAKEAVTTCQSASDKKGELLVRVALIDAHVAGDLFSTEGGEEAMAVADEAVTLAREVGDRIWESQMLNNKVQLHIREEDFASAQEVSSEAEALLQDLANESEQARILDTVANMHMANNDYTQAVETREKERELYQHTGETIREAMTMLQTCVAWCAAPLSKDNLEKGMMAAKEALSLCQEAEYKTGEAISLSCVAEIHLAGEQERDMDRQQALNSAKQAQEIFDEVENRPSEAILCRTLANAYLAVKNCDEAVNVASRAVELCKKVEDRRLLVDAQILLAQTLLDAAAIQSDNMKDNKDPMKIIRKAGSKAMKAAKDALSQARKLGDRALIASAVYTVALVNTSMNNSDDALKGANQAIELFRELKSKEGEVGAMALVAEAYYANNQNDKALDTANKVASAAQKYKDKVAENRASTLIDLIQGVQQWDWDYGAMEMAGGAEASGGGELAVEKKGLDPEFVRGIVGSTAQGALATDEEIHLDSPLMESGMDSLSSVAFRNTLNQQLQMNLPAALMFDYPSQRAIIDHVIETSKQ